MKGDSLPVGWKTVRVGAVATVKGGKRLPNGATYSSEPTKHPYVRVSDFAKGSVRLEGLKYIDEAVYREICNYTIRCSEVYISIAGTIGVTGRVPAALDGANLTENAAKIVPTAAIDADYLWRLFTVPAIRETMQASTKATTQPKLALFRIEALEIPLPPLNEQRRIVAKLEALQARSRPAREALDAVPPLLEKLRQSILAAAFRGDLTKDWRAKHKDVEPATELLKRIRTERRKKWEEAELAKMKAKGKAPADDKWKAKYKEPEPVDTTGLPELPEGWCWASAASIVAGDADIMYGIIQPGPALQEGVPYVRGMDIEDGVILEAQLLRTHPSIAARYERASLQGGDILVGIIRATKVAVVPASLEGANITQGTARFRPADGIATEYLAQWLESMWAQNWLHSRYRGIDMPGLNLRDVRLLPVPIAPMAEQEAIVLATSALRARQATTRGAYQKTVALCRALESSILAAAFRGGLVPQDPSDEPAEAVLGGGRDANGSATNGKHKTASGIRTPKRARVARDEV
jgi:type I restriction enzyme S subunit